MRLRLTRDDHGEDPRALGRAGIAAFTSRLAHLQRTGQMTFRTRLRFTRRAFRFFNDLHVLGLTGPGQPAAGLPASFALRRDDIPKDPERDARPRSLPPAVLQAIAADLGVLEQRCGVPERRITELLIDTGRRPDEICALGWDCLERDASGSPVLIYTDAKNNRPGRRLPVSEATAAVITAQKDWVRGRHPDTPVGDLALLPRDKGNRDGTKPILGSTYTHAHRIFADAIAHLLLDDDGQQIDPALVVPYAYRHSYAQRHADAGVAPDVLRELMSHRSMRTTTGYYRITETRIRAAIDRSPGTSSTPPGGGSSATSPACSPTSKPGSASGKSPSRSGCAPSRPTSRQAAAPAPTSTCAPAAGTSAATRPTCPS